MSGEDINVTSFQQRCQQWVTTVSAATQLIVPLSKVVVAYGETFQEVWRCDHCVAVVEDDSKNVTQRMKVVRRLVLRQDYDWFVEMPRPYDKQVVLDVLKTLPGNVKAVADALKIRPDVRGPRTRKRSRMGNIKIETKSEYQTLWNEYLAAKAVDDCVQLDRNQAVQFASMPLRRTWYSSLDELKTTDSTVTFPIVVDVPKLYHPSVTSIHPTALDDLRQLGAFHADHHDDKFDAKPSTVSFTLHSLYESVLPRVFYDTSRNYGTICDLGHFLNYAADGTCGNGPFEKLFKLLWPHHNH